MCCGDGVSASEFALSEHNHEHIIYMSLCGTDQTPTTCNIKLSSEQSFHIYQHVVIHQPIVLQNVAENCSERPSNSCEGQGRYGCLSGLCGVDSSCYKQDFSESRDNWIYVEGQAEWRFDLLSLPPTLTNGNLIEVRLENATFDGESVLCFYQTGSIIKYLKYLKVS